MSISEVYYHLVTLASVAFKLNLGICDRKLPVFPLIFETFKTLALILKLMNLKLMNSSSSTIKLLSLTKNNQVFPHTKPVSSTSEADNTTVQTHGLSGLSQQDKKKPLPQALQNFGQAEMSTKAMQ